MCIKLLFSKLFGNRKKREPAPIVYSVPPNEWDWTKWQSQTFFDPKDLKKYINKIKSSLVGHPIEDIYIYGHIFQFNVRRKNKTIEYSFDHDYAMTCGEELDKKDVISIEIEVDMPLVIKTDAIQLEIDVCMARLHPDTKDLCLEDAVRIATNSITKEDFQKHGWIDAKTSFFGDNFVNNKIKSVHVKEYHFDDGEAFIDSIVFILESGHKLELQHSNDFCLIVGRAPTK